MCPIPSADRQGTYEKIKKIHPDQKAVIISGFAQTEDIKATQRLDAGKFLKKPLTLQMVGMAVKEELNKKSEPWSDMKSF